MQPQPVQSAPPQAEIPRSLQFALCVTGLLWLFAARSAAGHAAQGISYRLNFSQYTSALLGEAFFLFLLLCGFAALSWISTRSGGIRRTNALPDRASAGREWLLGAALGWGMLLAAVLPMTLAGDLHPTFWTAPRAWLLTLITLLTVALNTLALEAAFRGYIFRRLIAAIGPSFATLILSAVYAILSSFRNGSTRQSVFITFLLGLLLSLAYLRTHALWIGWGLHFAWNAATGILLGLPVAGVISYNTLVDTNISGSIGITGGAYGPEAAPFTILCILVTAVVLYKVTRDLAWTYTHPIIIAAGYPMEVAPPPAHAAMEQATAATLVQILPTTATNPSTMPAIENHLRSSRPEDRTS